MSMNPLNDLSKVYMEQIASVDESAIGDRAKNAVADQRLDAAQRDTQQSVDKLAKREKVTGASASLAAKRVEADVRKSSSYGPQRPKPGTTGGYRIEENEIDEAVKGQDTEVRKAASAERRAGDTLTKKLPPYKGKEFGKYQGDQISYIDKKTKGKFIPGMATNEALDPVGQEDADIDNDGKKNTKSDKYLTNRRKVRGVAIKKESFSNWRQDLSEVMDTVDAPDDQYQKQIKEKKIQNKIKINPDFKEAVEEIGGQLIEMIEVEEGYQEIDREKETKMYRRAGNLARTSLSSKGKEKEDARNKSAKIVSAITRQKENERFNRIGQSPAHNEEFELDEKTLTSAETAKKEQIVKSMKKNFAGFKSSYGKDAKSVMYATATKQAKKLREAIADQASLSPQELQKQRQKATLDTQIAMLRKQSLSRAEKPTVTQESTADDALAMVRASVAKKHGAASIVGSPENKAAQAAQKPTEQPKRKLPSYSIPGAPKEKSYND